MRRVSVLAVGSAALLAASAGRAAIRVGGYAQEAAVARSIAAQGITYGGRHQQIERAHCVGLPRYGVQRSGSRNSYHRMKCDLTGADRHVYETQVLIVRSWSNGFSWQIVSGTRRF